MLLEIEIKLTAKPVKGVMSQKMKIQNTLNIWVSKSQKKTHKVFNWRNVVILKFDQNFVNHNTNLIIHNTFHLGCILIVVCILISWTTKSVFYMLQLSLLEIWRQIKRRDWTKKRSTKNINDQNSLKTIIWQKFLEVVPCKS